MKSSHDSIRRTVTANWAVTNEGTAFEMIIPPDTIAIIELPGAEGTQLLESDDPIESAKGIKVQSSETDGTLRLEADSGHYRFRMVLLE